MSQHRSFAPSTNPDTDSNSVLRKELSEHMHALGDSISQRTYKIRESCRCSSASPSEDSLTAKAERLVPVKSQGLDTRSDGVADENEIFPDKESPKFRPLEALIISADVGTCVGLREVLLRNHLIPLCCSTLSEAETALLQHPVCFVLSDYIFPDGDFHDALAAVEGSASRVPVIIVCRTMDSVRYLETMSPGAFDGIGLPWASREQPPMEVLLVGDGSHVDALVLTHRLRRRGFQCHCVGTRRAAFHFLNSRGVDIVLSQMCLPDGSGFGLVAALTGLPAKAFFCLPIGDSCFRLPAIDRRGDCWEAERLLRIPRNSRSYLQTELPEDGAMGGYSFWLLCFPRPRLSAPPLGAGAIIEGLSGIATAVSSTHVEQSFADCREARSRGAR
jgi:CheY-like chemotaxis protein